MLRRINFEEIREISEELKKEVNELKNKNEKLKMDVLKIRNYYQGEDAEIIITKFNERTKYIEEYIKILEVYDNYFEWVSSAYNESYTRTLTDLESMITDIMENFDTLNIGIEGGNNV